MTKQEATDFFSEIYGGEHHIPKGKVNEFGLGWMVKHDRGELATYDGNMLTRLVLLAHEKCYRVGISPLNFNTLEIAIWKRKPTGGISERHPTMMMAIESFLANRPKESAENSK